VSGELVAVLVGVLLVAGAAGFALLPLVRGARRTDDVLAPPDDPRLERQQLYRAVLDLEFDRQTGKLSQADFEQLSGELLARAADQLRATRGQLEDVDAQIEREIAAARRALAAAASAAASGRAGPTTPVGARAEDAEL
jgi:hypothetical protein